MTHYTDDQLAIMFEQSKYDHVIWVGSDIRCLIADIREARSKIIDNESRVACIVIPPGHANAEEFADDCGFQLTKTPSADHDAGNLRSLADRLEDFLRVLESARASQNKTISVWSGDVVTVAGALNALRAEPPQSVQTGGGGRDWRKAVFTYEYDEVAGHLYYFAPQTTSPGPFLQQRHVQAIVDIASDGTFAGVELIDNMPPLERPPSSRLTDGDQTGGVK